MESFLSRYKNALVLILVLLAQVIGVAIQVRRPLPKEHAQPDAGGVRLIRYWAISLVSPPERLVHWLGASILGVWDNYIDLIHVRQQNHNLQAELQRLRIEEGGIAEDARQGQRLQQLLAFKEKYVYKTLPAQVIGTSGTEQSRILAIDKGAKDGVAVDMPVITPDGIVGRVREVFPHTSQVLEITDPTSGAGVILATTRTRGILRGNALGQPQIVSVMPDDRIKPGEAVVTSGGDQIFPRGLAVGYVDHVVVDPDHDPLVDVVLRPAANLAQLDEVLVITNMGSAVLPRQKLDMIQSEAIASTQQLNASEILAERLPSRVDPDAPPDETSSDSASADGDSGGTALHPPMPLRPDRFSPNSMPAAADLTPGARMAPESEGVLKVVRPHPAAPPSNPSASAGNTAGTTAATAAAAPRKKGPELVPDDGSRPLSSTRPAGSSAVGTANTAARMPHETAPRPGAAVANGNPSEPKTRIIVDGPMPSAARKPASTPSTATHPRQSPATAPAQHPPSTVPAQRKGPQLVPDDGSRPPPSMLQKPRPKPQQPASEQSRPPQGGRG